MQDHVLGVRAPQSRKVRRRLEAVDEPLGAQRRLVLSTEHAVTARGRRLDRNACTDVEVPARCCLGRDGGDVPDRLVAEDVRVLVAHDAADGAVVLAHVGAADPGGLDAQQRVPRRERVRERELAHLHLLVADLDRRPRSHRTHGQARPNARRVT